MGKDPQLAAIRAARRFATDKIMRVAPPHRLLDPRHGPLLAVRLSVLTRKSLGGLHTDLQSRVLDAAGQPVPGLFAAGEAAGFGGGGIHGYRALEGTFLGGCLFSGRSAGRAAASAVVASSAVSSTGGKSMQWRTDILGDDFQACAFEAAGPDGVLRTATLVRHTPLPAGRERHRGAGCRHRAVLFLHGWSDYFFNEELAEFWAGKGFEFFALDMHNHGRSLRPGTHGGYVADLDNYDAEITAAIGIIGSLRPDGAAPQLTLMGHSTGGLIAALWADRHPGVASQLVLDSPWLEVHGSPALRRAARTMVEPFARFWPESVIRLPERAFYWRSISSAAEGEWALDDAYRPPHAFPVRAGWLSAVLSRAVQGGARPEHRRAHPGADFGGQRQRDVLEGVDAPHGRGPGREHNRPARPQPGPHRHAGAD